MAYNKRQKLQDNIAAIRTVFQLEKEGRTATDAEREVLKRYSGFGGLKFVLKPTETTDDKQYWNQSELTYFDQTKELFDVIRDGARDDREAKELTDSIKRSVNTAFYTPQPVIGAIAKVMKDAGVEVQSMLDPSAGIGKFGEAFKGEYPNVKVSAFEKDLLTGRILKALNPQDSITIDGFETISPELKGTFDVATSNIPFGDIKVMDDEYRKSGNDAKRYAVSTIHNYFFLKALDQVREGGFVAFITSRGFMDSPSNNPIREELAKNARLVGAFRLPDGMFRDEAGTDVGSDLVVLQKYTGYDMSLDPDTQAFCDVNKGFKAMSGEDWTDISMNCHWWKSMMAPDSEAIVATKMEKGTDPYGKPTLICTHDGGMEGIAKLLTDYFKRDLYKDFVDYYKANANREQSQVILNSAEVQLGLAESKTNAPKPVHEVQVKAEPQIRQAQQSQPVQLDLFSMWDAVEPVQEARQAQQPEEKPQELTPDEQRMQLYYQIRDAYEELYDTEAQSREEQPELRQRLNQVYDEFVGKFGRLNERKNARVIMNDAKGRDVLTLENAVDKLFVKADIFERPVSFVAYEISHVDTPEEALFASLNRYGNVDLEYMSGLTGHTQDDLVSELKGRIYYMPDGRYEISSKALSGNVYDKLAYVSDALELAQEHADDPKIVPALQETKDALEQSLPQQIAFDDIGLQFGERWIPTEYYEEYVGKLFDTKMEIHYAEHIDEYSIKAENRYNLKIREEYCVRGEYKDYDGMALLQHAFHDTTPDIQKCVGSDDSGNDIKAPDMEKIQLANSKIQEIREGFQDYLTNLPKEKRDELQEMYNRKFNCFVKAKYDGSHQTFPGIDMKTLGSSRFNVKDIYKSQKDCVWMLLQNGGGICDHEVGTGKTLIMCMAAHEMHRLGLANKPMIIALKANVAEIANTYQAAFPDDKILYASEKDFSPANRVDFFNRIKNNDYACVIMSHDQFGKIPQSPDIQRQILSDEVRDIDEALDVLRKQGGNISGRMLTGLEKRKENLQVKLLELQSDMASRKDDFVDFGLMGIDHIFIDESHQFKNLTFTTRHQRVSGLGNPAGSQKALNLLYAIRTIQNRTGKDLGATFLSGTTISNSLTELYLLFKYLRPKAMEQQGIHSFDAWAAVYAKKTSDYEFSVTNAVVQKERFRYFVKVPELATFYNEITDYRTGEDVGLDRPDMNVVLHNIKPTPDQQDFNERLVQFAQTGDGELIFRGPLNDREQKGKMLIATDASRKASLDMRLVDPELFGDDPENKASHCARLVSEYYQKYNDQKGTQFIFSDLSTYKPGEWNIFQEIKDKLVNDYGIPAEEIRFIQEAKNEKQRKELIKAMNEGTIRVLFGSTSTLGTGVNAQKRAVAVHHIDIPWRPSDLEQRNGRARRSGNEIAKLYANNNVDIIIYAVERTLDSYKFNLLQNKQLFITQLKTNSLGSRVIDEGAMDEENGMNFAEYVAILSGNDDLLQKAKLEKKIMALESERKTYMQARRETEWRLEVAQEKVQKNDVIIRDMTEDYDKFQSQVRKGEDGTALPGLTMPKIKEFTADGAYNVEGMGAALQDAGRTIGNKDRQMGEVYGFPLMVDSIYMYDEKMRKEVYAGNRFYVKGHYLYEHNNGHLAMSKDNRLGAVRYGVQALERIPSIVAQYQERNHKLQQDIAEYQRIAGKPWGKEDDLKGLKAELEVLEKKIQESLDETTRNVPKPEELPYKFSKEGRYHKVTFQREAYPFVSISEMREMADTGSWRQRGYVRCGHWDGDVMVSDPEVEAEFTLRQKCEEFMQKVVDTNQQRVDDKEWLVNMANNDTDGKTVTQDNEVIFATRKFLEEHHINWQTGEDVTAEQEVELRESTSARVKPLQVYSLGQYGVGERGEQLRSLAHQVKENGSQEAIDNAVDELETIFSTIPESERERMVLVPVPGKTGVPGYTDDIAYDLGQRLDIDSNSNLICSPHASLYDIKKEQGNDNLPDIDFTYNDELDEDTIVVLVDNVLDTGHTLSQAAQADFGKGVEVRALVLAHTDNYLQYHPEMEVKMPQAQEVQMKPVAVAPVRIAAQVARQEQKEDRPSVELRDALIGLMRGAGIAVNTDAAEGARVLEKYKDQANESRKPILFRDKDGQVYGFVHEGKVYLDPDVATVETPIHEYTHLWAEVLRQQNPGEWAKVVQMMKDTPEVWNDVKSQYPNLHTDDEITSEALAQYSGQRGTKRLQEFVEEKGETGIFEKVSAALSKFWNAVADFLHIEYNSKEEVADRVLYDLLNGVNPLKLAPKVQGLEDYTQYEVKQMVEDYVNEKLSEDFPDEDISVKQVTIIGSRSRGEAREGSDLDILLEYDGEGIKEDTLFNVLNENRLEINGIPVDINPINPHYSMNTAEWLERDVKWREEDRQKQQLAKQHDEVVQKYQDAGLSGTPQFLLKEAELVRQDTGEVEHYNALSVDPPYIMLYEGMEDAKNSMSPMMLTDFSPEVQKQVLEELTDSLKCFQEKSAIEKVCGLAEEVKLDYVPLTLRLPVVVRDYDDGMEKGDKVFAHAVAVGGDIEVFENRQDAYDHQNQVYLKELPEEARQQVLSQMEELLTSEDRQISVYVDTVQVPDYALPAIINGDFSNLDAEETANVQQFMDEYPGHIFSPRDEHPSFNNSPAFGLAADCVAMDIVRLATIKQLREEQTMVKQEEPDTIESRKPRDVQEIIKDLKNRDDGFRYRLLSRMQTDVKYYLGNGNRHEKDLWAGNAKDHIIIMDALMSSLPEKPEWLSTEMLIDYADKMGVNVYNDAPDSALMVEALDAALANKGVWLNKCGAISADDMKLRQVKPYEALVMALQSDTRGECPKEIAINQESAQIKQVNDLKQKHPDAMILMRTGDCYKMYGEDAEKGARILGITLCDRESKGDRYLFAVFPHHSLDVYLPKLVRAGLRVAICDPLDNPNQEKNEAKVIYDKADELVKALQKGDPRVQVNQLLDTEYDYQNDGLCINNGRKSAHGQEKAVAIQRVTDIYRAAMAYTGGKERLNRVGLSTLLPADAQKYERLVQELATGVIMVRQGLSATFSKENQEIIPYWKQELTKHPEMMKHVEQDVNKAIQVLGKIMRGEDIDYAAMRGNTPSEVVTPYHYSIASELATIPDAETQTMVLVKDDQQKSVGVIASDEDSVQGVVAEDLHQEGYKDVQFYHAGGASSLIQPNTFFDGKTVEVARLKQDKLTVTEQLDLTKEIERCKGVALDQVTMTRDDKGCYVLYVKPKDKPSITVYPHSDDVRLFFGALKTPEFDSVREQLGQKYYATAQRHPDVKVDVLMPKVGDVDLSRISKVSIAKDRYKEGATILFATIDGERQKPVELSKIQAQRFWLVDDREAYKVALAAQLFHARLSQAVEEDTKCGMHR